MLTTQSSLELRRHTNDTVNGHLQLGVEASRECAEEFALNLEQSNESNQKLQARLLQADQVIWEEQRTNESISDEMIRLFTQLEQTQGL